MKYLSTFSDSLYQAIDRYHAIDKKLARRFVEAVDHATQEVIRFPKIGRLKGRYRKLPVRDFPYQFCYSENLDGELVALVLFHNKQREPHVLSARWPKVHR
jgi:plasmid stabilization system protein ParE